MRFVQSLDDSVLAHIAGGLTAVVAAATALFSGHTLMHTGSEPVPVRPLYVDSADSSDSVYGQSVESTPYFDTAEEHLAVSVAMVSSTGSGATTATTATDVGATETLSHHVLRKEDDVDALNTQLDGILKSVKTRQVHRRR